MNHKPRFLLAFCMLIYVFWVAACVSSQSSCPPLEQGEVELEFETLDRFGFSGGLDFPREGLLVVMNDAGDFSIPNPQYASSKQLQGMIDDLNFDQYFVVGVVRNVSSSGEYYVDINRISQKGRELRVCTYFWEPGQNQPSIPIVSNPYHFVRVTRDPDLETSDTAILQTITVKGVFPNASEPD